MSFHEDSFHETKRERKKYEDKKQKALEEIENLLSSISIGYSISTPMLPNILKSKLRHIAKLVNDI